MSDMTMTEAMERRHTVRRYTDQPLPPELAEKLRRRAEEHNERHCLAIRLMTDDTGAFNGLIRLFLAKGVKNFFILAGEDEPDLDRRLGYSGADLMLYAQTLGLNTWWVGGTFHRKKLSEQMPGTKVIGVIAVGYGATQGVPHKSKGPEEVSAYAGTAPEWFQRGVEAALLAPTALARQAFFIKGERDRVSVSCDSGIFSGADMGLVTYHFELGAGKESFRWAERL